MQTLRLSFKSSTFGLAALRITARTAISTIYSAILIKIEIMLTDGSFRLDTMVKMMIPMISSRTAAPRIALPTGPFSLPISRSASTVILTEVAVRITPMKTHFKTSLKSDASTWK